MMTEVTSPPIPTACWVFSLARSCMQDHARQGGKKKDLESRQRRREASGCRRKMMQEVMG
jgi:hypothetical protein